MKLAIKIADVCDDDDMHQTIYNLTHPLKGYHFVVVSAINRPKLRQKETLIFGLHRPSERFCEISFDDDEKALNAWRTLVDWTALNGSIRGVFDHKRALKLAGYEMISEMDIN